MDRIATKAGLAYRMAARARSLLGYGMGAWRDDHGSWGPRADRLGTGDEARVNELLKGYPRNHNYRVQGGRLVPCFRLYERLRLIRPLIEGKSESFLDVGCCRGFYVFDVARRPECRLAVGVDVHKPFVDAANEVRTYLSVDNAHFQLAQLDEVAEDPAKFGGPFQTVLLIGTYHYLFWGSSLCPTAHRDHGAILRRLRDICTDQVIFSARLDVDRLPAWLRSQAEQSDAKNVYTSEGFRACTEQFFRVRPAGYLGTYPLLVLDKHRDAGP